MLASSRALRVLAPAVALSYPAWLACAVRVSPVFAFAALAVPAVGLGAALALARGGWRPRALAIALLAVAAPPLYTLLGGWLDFQRAIPLDGTRAWIAIWLALVVVAWVEPERRRPARPPVGGRLAFAHGVSAVAICVFVAAHLANHVGALWGGDEHVAIMRALRTIYRARDRAAAARRRRVPAVSGALLVRRKLAHTLDAHEVVQTASGTVLLVFFASHVSAVLRARDAGVDTAWPWLATDTLLHDAWNVRLVPYYALAVLAVGVHVGGGLRTIVRAHGRPRAAGVVFAAAAAGAALVSATIMIAMLR